MTVTNVQRAPVTLLSATGISLRIDGRPLFDDVHFSIQHGSRIGLTGPSGCGKSTFLRSLAMLTPTDSGNIHWRGNSVEDSRVPYFRSHVLYLAQQPARFSMTLEEYFRAPFDLHVHRQKEFRRESVVEQFDRIGKSSSLLSQPHENLSGGEAQIANLIRAMMLDPQILLLDEPTSGLDSKAVDAVESLIKSWRENDPTRAYVWVSHDHDQVTRMCDDVRSFPLEH